ncbi:MAG: type toxin-antitoxin system YafQ family toxin [Pseudomonadota bacterium]|nr:type toxin-antitoxin system YafQ family toxin [Pseudomonadota bacterium]
MKLQAKANDLGFSVSSYVRHLVKKTLTQKNFLELGLNDLKNGMMELHLSSDDLLIYFKIDNESITLVAIGSHAELFG